MTAAKKYFYKHIKSYSKLSNSSNSSDWKRIIAKRFPKKSHVDCKKSSNQ